jgi:hypothetical protein
MNRHLRASFYILIIVALCSVPCTAQVTGDYKMLTALGSTYETTPEERELDSKIVNAILEYASYTGEYVGYNWYGYYTDATHIYFAANGYNSWYNYSVSWYIGHGNIDYWWCIWGWPWHWHGPHWYIQADDGSIVFDCDIYEYTEAKVGRFAFLWSCHQADVIGSIITYPCGMKAQGMPLGWLHTSSLSSDGYKFPDNGGYTFIGFEGEAPFFTNPYWPSGELYKFVDHFYFASLVTGAQYSIKDALDYASLLLWGKSFNLSNLYNGYNFDGHVGRIRVYGDGNLHISKHVPLGCPILYVYDGLNYVCEGLLNIHNPDGIDITCNHVLTTKPQLVKNVYLLRLIEHPKTHSRIDQVKLYAVLEDRVIVPLQLTSAISSQKGNVLQELLVSDNEVVDNAPNDVIDLKFRSLPKNAKVTCFIFQVEGCNSDEKE